MSLRRSRKCSGVCSWVNTRIPSVAYKWPTKMHPLISSRFRVFPTTTLLHSTIFCGISAKPSQAFSSATFHQVTSHASSWVSIIVVHKLSKLYNPDVVLTDDSEGTKYASVCNVTQHLKLLAQRKWKPNDTLFLFFSGHACNLPDNVDDFSAKGMDEAFCLVDNAGEITFASCLRDDDVAACIRALPKDVRVVVLLDLSNPDSSPFDLSNFVFEQEVCVLETCSENEGESAGQMIVDSVLEMVPIGPHSRRTIQCTEFGNNFLRQCTRLHRPSRRKASILGGLANALCMQAVSSSINDAGGGLCTPHDRTPSRKKERIPGSQRCFRVQGKASLRWPAPRQT
eukprot:GEMP01021515.1.p1 GENE.GEMP01021515.1~~GEMP01021515.1.p1  ORF type:complete len:341 (+),score=61.34 GEMP01021515.1:360-1382(+)